MDQIKGDGSLEGLKAIDPPVLLQHMIAGRGNGHCNYCKPINANMGLFTFSMQSLFYVSSEMIAEDMKQWPYCESHIDFVHLSL